MRFNYCAIFALIGCFASKWSAAVAACDTGCGCVPDQLDGGCICDPPQFVWTNNRGTLGFGEHTQSYNSGDLITRAYGQDCQYSIPGPTITMKRGETYILTFRNELPESQPDAAENTLKDPDITNLHLHGMHISPESPGDDVLRVLPGKREFDYVWEVPADHMGGAHWLHPHHHGSTMLHVAGGAYSLVLIDDSGDNLPQTVKDMDKRQFVIHYLAPQRAGGAGGDTLLNQSTLPDGFFVNGIKDGRICLPTGKWIRWQILLADPDARDKTLGLGGSCEAYVLAHDGVWRVLGPKKLEGSQITMHAAARAELAVKCTANSDLTVDGTTVASIEVYGSDAGAGDPFVAGGFQWNINRPDYLRDLVDDTVLANLVDNTLSMGATSINGQSFDKSVPLYTFNHAEDVYELEVKSASAHPYHQHIYHMQIVSCKGSTPYEPGEWYDTISANCKFRFNKENGFSGKMIAHCHILEHEDNGGMVWYDLTTGSPGPSSDGVTVLPARTAGTTCGAPTSPPPPPAPSASPSMAPSLRGTTSLSPSAVPSSAPSRMPTAGCSGCACHGGGACKGDPLCTWSKGTCVNKGS